MLRTQKWLSNPYLVTMLALLMMGFVCLVTNQVASAAIVRQCSSGSVLKQGSNNTCVNYAKRILNSTTDTGNAIKVNNKFSSATKTKTKLFQTTRSIVANGVIDALTWQQLCSVAKTNLPDIYRLAGCMISNTSYSVAAMVNGCGTMQGGASDGTYFYFACRGPGKNKIRIVKYSMTGEKVAESRVFSRKELGHANDITYNSRLNMLVVSAWDDRSKGNNGIRSTLRFIDPLTFQINDSKTLSNKGSATTICYNPVTDQYISNGMLYDSNLTYLRTIYNMHAIENDMGLRSEKKVLSQGMDCDQSYIYVLYVAFRQSGYNMVGVYDWNGTHIGTHKVALNDEGENISMVNGVMYMGINEGGMSRGGDYRNDYFIRLGTIPYNALSL